MSPSDVAAAETTAPEEDFEAMLAESFITQDQIEGRVVSGRVVAVESDFVLMDVGLKSEGRVPMREFAKAGEDKELQVGDRIDVFLERIENAHNEAVLSRDKARREEAWNHLEVAFDKNERVEGHIFGRVKGGFTVDLNGAVAFLPISSLT